jgi:hypothetical protein
LIQEKEKLKLEIKDLKQHLEDSESKYGETLYKNDYLSKEIYTMRN